MQHFTDPALLIALMLLAAILGGYGGVAARVPRVVGFLIGGLVLSQLLEYGAGFETPFGNAAKHVADSADIVNGIKTLALGLIMISIGGVFEVEHLKITGPRLVKLSIVKLTATFVCVGGGCWLVAALTDALPANTALPFALLLGIVGLATAPAATLFVLREYEAKGPTSESILALTGLNNILCIVAFHAAFLLLTTAGWIESGYGTGRWLWLDLLLTTVGSVALGVILGFLFSLLYAKVTVADFMLIFIAAIVMLGAFRDILSQNFHLSYNFLLTCLFLGATFANITPDQQAFHASVRTLAGPIFAIFFVFAGFELHLEDLPNLGLVGITYIFMRIVGKIVGGWWGVRWTRSGGEINPHIGWGMLCQAGVAIGLADFLAGTWGDVDAAGVFSPHPAARSFETIVLASVVVFEIIGPIALRWVALRSGEVKAVTLLRRRRTPGNDRDSLLGITWQALLRTASFGKYGARRPTAPTGQIQVRHIMRSNVKVLAASAPFDEVLRFVENSRHNHFPVVEEDGRYAGMIHYSDLRNMLYEPGLRELVTAVDLARESALWVSLDTPIEKLLDTFKDRDFGSLAVLDDAENRQVVGLVEQRDLLVTIRQRQHQGRA